MTKRCCGSTRCICCVAFIPVPSATLEHYANQPSAIAFYSLCLALTSVLSLIMWGYATRHHRLVNTDLARSSIQSMFRRGGVTIIVALLAIAAAYVHIALAFGVWLLFLLAVVPFGRLYNRLLSGSRME